MNAEVDAAGSGEHGRGFAVVASEYVPGAAQRHGRARYRALIGVSVAEVDGGGKLADQAGAVDSIKFDWILIVQPKFLWYVGI